MKEGIQWKHDLLFRIGGKIFAGISLDAAAANRVSFKCTPEKFAELTEREGIIPAEYVGGYHWVTVEQLAALSSREFKELITNSYEMVRAKLPGKERYAGEENLVTVGRQKRSLPPTPRQI